MRRYDPRGLPGIALPSVSLPGSPVRHMKMTGRAKKRYRIPTNHQTLLPTIAPTSREKLRSAVPRQNLPPLLFAYLLFPPQVYVS